LRVIGFVGMPGSGKSEASDVARGMGLPVVVMGDIIRGEAAHLGLEPTDESLGGVGNILRSQEGPDAVARRTLKAAEMLGRSIVVVDGIRSRAEVDFFRANSTNFYLVEVLTSTKARLKRIAARRRSDDAHSHECEEALQRRDLREIGWGMCEAILEADVQICNEGDLDSFRTSVRGLLEDIISGRAIQTRALCD
jgi:dephospho-CoA kinase